MPAIPYKKCDMSADAWDGAAEQKKLDANKTTCRAMYLWEDPEGDPETKAAYKFPFRFVDDTGMPADGSIKACQTIIGVLNGGRGGADIPDGDREGVYNVTARHLKDADVEPPELRSLEDIAEQRAAEIAIRTDDSQPDAVHDATMQAARDESGLRHGREGKRRLVRSVSKQSIRAMDSGVDAPGVRLKILQYNVVDDYGSVWLPGCLNKGLSLRLPQLTWGHDWHEALGRAFLWTDSPDGPELDFYFDDFDAVPRARQAYAQVKSGTIDDCSVGFGWDYIWRPPTQEEQQRWPGCGEIIIEADLDEVALVLRGAVPNAKVLTARSAQRGMVVEREYAKRLQLQVAQGEISLDEALAAIQSAAIEMQPTNTVANVGDPSLLTVDKAQLVPETESRPIEPSADLENQSNAEELEQQLLAALETVVK